MTDHERHAIWWHVYPLGFLGAEPRATGGPPVHRLRRLVGVGQQKRSVLAAEEPARVERLQLLLLADVLQPLPDHDERRDRRVVRPEQPRARLSARVTACCRRRSASLTRALARCTSARIAVET